MQPISGNLYLATIVVNLAALAIGCHFTWTSPSIPKLQASDSWLHIDTDQASWIGSLVSCGAAFGPLAGGWLVDYVGRRRTIILSVCVSLISWGVLYQTTRVREIYISRFLGGVAGGIMMTAVPLYISEIAQDEVRSALAPLFNLFIVAGMLIEYIVGPYVSFSTLIWVSCVPPVIFFLTSPCMPESPYYLLQHGHEEKAYKNLSLLRKGASKDQVSEELNMIKKSIEESEKNKGTLLDMFRSQGNRRAIWLSCSCVTLQQLSGINVILYYSQTIFQMAGRSSLSPSESTIIVGTVLLLAAGVAVPLTHLFGIKNTLLISAIGMSLSLGFMGLYCFLVAMGEDTSSYNWLPLVSLLSFVMTFSFGFGPLPWAVMAEVSPPNLKGIASALTTSCCWSASFILTKMFPILAEELDMYIIFWSFSGFSAFAFFFVLFFLPDTRGLSLQAIQDLLHTHKIQK